ncbi:MAG: hypothetical protein OXB84_08585 [Halobacteriovoraceae bacterium]|nr:hypothetical protein [Halobacteriovoraceae bacterium]
MDFTVLYRQILDQLRKDVRPLISLDDNQVDSLCEQTREVLALNDRKGLMMFLCILDNTRTMNEKLDQLALDILNHENLA